MGRGLWNPRQPWCEPGVESISQMGHNRGVPQQSKTADESSGLGWPINVSRETLTTEADQIGTKVGLGWPT